MTTSDIAGLIITSIIGLLFTVMALVLLTGRGAFLIAGYNTASKKEKQKYDSKALCRFMGKILLPIGIATPLVGICSIYGIDWIHRVYTFGIIALSAFAIIYANTGNRFEKEE